VCIVLSANGRKSGRKQKINAAKIAAHALPQKAPCTLQEDKIPKTSAKKQTWVKYPKRQQRNNCG